MPQPPNEFDQLDDPEPHDRNASALAAEEAYAELAPIDMFAGA